MNEEWKATARLRWKKETATCLTQDGFAGTMKLQQWFAADVPGYMRRDAEGEWRDVVVEET